MVRNFCGGLFLRSGDFLSFAETNSYVIWTEWFFWLGINFCNFQKEPSTQHPALMTFSFLLNTCNRNTYFQTIWCVCTLCKTSKFIVYRFLSERKRQVVFEQTRFLSTVFLSSEFKLENIYSGANFCGKNVCGNFYLRELIFADRWAEKSQKLEPAKISCRTVVHLIHSRKSGKHIVLSG